jgi:citrate lyase subunit beta/citryl-CoA lyase
MTKPSQPIRPRRSVLYMPGANTRALEKAKSLPADALIFDLEDAVAPDAKEEARGNVVAAAQDAAKGEYGKREIAIRANGLETRWGYADLAAIAQSGADAALIPKVESAADVEKALRVLDEHGAPAEMALWCMMETPRGILNAQEIAGASSRVAVWVMGTNDIAKEIRGHHTPMRLPFITALGICVLAARAADIVILDGVYNDIKNEQGFAESCTQGLELGFDGKTLIHPSQIEPCNATFGPSEGELDFAAKVLEAWKEAEAAGKGVVTVDGRMVENLHVEQAKRQLALAAAIEELQAAG